MSAVNQSVPIPEVVLYSKRPMGDLKERIADLEERLVLQSKDSERVEAVDAGADADEDDLDNPEVRRKYACLDLRAARELGLFGLGEKTGDLEVREGASQSEGKAEEKGEGEGAESRTQGGETTTLVSTTGEVWKFRFLEKPVLVFDAENENGYGNGYADGMVEMEFMHHAQILDH